MHKLIALTVGIVALLSGCNAPQKTQTWAAVKAVRHPRPVVPDRDRSYAKELHETLQRSGVEHKVVTFTFRYTSRTSHFEPAEGTAVIYRDTGTPAHPWWFMEESLSSPVWLPTEPVERQIAFRLGRPATVVKIEEFPSKTAKPCHDSHKQHVPIAKQPAKSEPAKMTPPPAETKPAEEPKTEAGKKPAAPVNIKAVPTGKLAPAAKPSPSMKPVELQSQRKNATTIKFRRSAPVLTSEESIPEAKSPPVATGPGTAAPRSLELSDPVRVEPGRPGSTTARPNRKP